MKLLASVWDFGPAARRRRRTAACAVVLGLACLGASAQNHGGPPGGGGMGNMGGSMGRQSIPSPNSNPAARTPAPIPAPSRSSSPLGPSGRWWDDKNLARSIGLAPQQQHRMDDVFSANRDTLAKAYKTLQHEESQLQKITRNRELDENAIYQQIDRVTAARGELEKVNAHMLLQIRKELTPEQTGKLDQLNADATQ